MLAANRKVKRNGQTFYFRRYPSHGFAAQTIGYSTSALSQTGLEQSLNDYLTGATTNLSNAIQRTLDQTRRRHGVRRQRRAHDQSRRAERSRSSCSATGAAPSSR